MTERGKLFIKLQENRALYSRKYTEYSAYPDGFDKDGNTVYAIGYGNHFDCDNKPIPKDMKASAEECERIFECSLPGLENYVRGYITNYDSLNDDKKDALMSFMYNVGPGQFEKSQIRTQVNLNPDNPDIKNVWLQSFVSYLNQKTKKLEQSNALKERRNRESELYFGRATGIPEVDAMSGNTGSTPNPEVYDPSYGIDNMFYELSHNSDWSVVKFKRLPTKQNNWRYLSQAKTRPKVGDLLFGYHDERNGGIHDHVAIYLGLHNGTQYVAEGLSVSGRDIQNTTEGIQIVAIDKSRLGLGSDVISHFAHYNKKAIKQTTASNTYVPYVRRSNSTNINYSPVVGKDNMQYFTLFGAGGKGLMAPSDTNGRKIPKDETYTNIQENLIALCNYILDPLEKIAIQEDIGRIYITSGYRTPEENAKNPDASNISQHMHGEAADIAMVNCPEGKSPGACLLRLAQIVLELEANPDTGFKYDQMILEGIDKTAWSEYNKTIPEWIHITFRKGNNREYSGKNKLAYMVRNRPGRGGLGPYKEILPSVVTNQQPFN